jgi:hypothetical protein
MEAVLKQILGEIQIPGQKMINVEQGQDKLGNRIAEMDNRLGSRIDEIGNRINVMGNQIVEMDSRLGKLEVRVENEVINKIRGLYDFREVQMNHNQCVIDVLQRIEAKVDILQVETAHVRKVR